ncbi:transmembrane protein 270 isoform X1 [Pongo abelii]|uniref:transmembrane protein 270 isoform X1 n=1 Tax=Pongo abelii TaxID=9601 RepID=UPI003004EBB4
MGFHQVDQAGLELLTSGDPSASASQSAGITGVSHRVQLEIWKSFWISLFHPSHQLIQNRDHLYNFLLLKINLFNHWVSGLAQEARGSCNWQARLPLGAAACPLGQALRAGLALIQVPVWLVLQGPRLMWAGMWGGTRTLGLAMLSAWEQLGLSVAIWTDLFLSCLHGLMLVALLLVVVTWRMCQKSHCFRPGRQLSKALQVNCVVRKLLAQLRRLYWWVETMTALTSWHLAYLITWTTCLASHLLQAAFEHTTQLAQAQEVEPQEVSGSSLLPSLSVSSDSESGLVLPEQETPRE